MNAAELRKAWERVRAGTNSHKDDWLLVDSALRTIALPILEADPELVERVAGVLSSIEVTPSQHHPSEMIDWARAVLAAITESQ